MGEYVAGLDGCKIGWVMVTASLEAAAAPCEVRVVTDLREVVADIDSGRFAAVTIDIPVGLPPDGPRPVDRLARSRLGGRKSSVFPAPIRPVLAASTYEDACDVSRTVCGKAISRQLFAILPKIREVDLIESPALQERFVEMHPEVSFAELAGAPMNFHKRRAEGRLERLHALRRDFPDVEVVSPLRIRGTQPDDILDAFVGAWSARRFATGTHLQLGGEPDETGLRMEIIA